MRPDDLAAVLAIERSSFPNPWPPATFLGEIQNQPVSNSYVAVAGPSERKKVIGYMIYWLVGDEAQVNNIAVHPDFRRRGIGEAMLRRALDMIRAQRAVSVILEVRASNLAALGLYRKLGFTELGRRKGYYFNPVEDALVLGFQFA